MRYGAQFGTCHSASETPQGRTPFFALKFNRLRQNENTATVIAGDCDTNAPRFGLRRVLKRHKRRLPASGFAARARATSDLSNNSHYTPQ